MLTDHLNKCLIKHFPKKNNEISSSNNCIYFATYLQTIFKINEWLTDMVVPDICSSINNIFLRATIIIRINIRNYAHKQLKRCF